MCSCSLMHTNKLICSVIARFILFIWRKVGFYNTKPPWGFCLCSCALINKCENNKYISVLVQELFLNFLPKQWCNIATWTHAEHIQHMEILFFLKNSFISACKETLLFEYIWNLFTGALAKWFVIPSILEF